MFDFENVSLMSGGSWLNTSRPAKIKSSFDPWNSIKKYNENILINRIKTIISEKIVNRPDIIELIREKKEYLILNPDKTSYEEISVEKWIHFLPPLVDIKLNQLTKKFPNLDANILGVIREEKFKMLKKNDVMKPNDKAYVIINSDQMVLT